MRQDVAMIRTKAIVTGDTLQSDGDKHSIRVESAAWYRWLEHATVFYFADGCGSFTARKERFQRGGWYWRAYRKRDGKLRRVYLGKAEALTLHRLRAAATTLARHAEEKHDLLVATPVASRHETQPNTPTGSTPAVVEPLVQEPSDTLFGGGPLLSTKLKMPAVPTDLVPRPRLIDCLDAGVRRALTIVSAPAGSGKTTLLSVWARAHNPSVAWMSLDAQDNDPARFWRYGIAALQTQQPGIGAHSVVPSQSFHSLYTTMLVNLINALAAIRSDVVLVLDDYQVITNAAIHTALQFFIEHAPPHVHVVIASRSIVPLPLARLRAQRRVAEITATDMHFTRDESVTFLAQTIKLELPEDVATLHTRTEGWIGGLQLAACAIQRCDDVSSVVRHFTGSHRYVEEYFADEVLSQQPAHMQRFLLHTSILDRLNASLCDAVVGGDEDMHGASRTLLEALHNANLFVVPLDEQRCWYRYHHLFVDFLRERLQQTHSEIIPTLHRRATAWYINAGCVVEAVTHALAAGDISMAADLIEQTVDTMLWLRGEVTPLLHWLAALPHTVIKLRPRLCLAYAWALFITGKPVHTIEPWLCDVEYALHRAHNLAHGDELHLPPAYHEVGGEVAALRACLLCRQADLPRAMDVAQQALAQLSPSNVRVRGLVTLHVGEAYRVHGNVLAANHAAAEAWSLSQQTTHLFTSVGAFCRMAVYQSLQGNLHNAAALYQQALDLVAERDARSLPVTGHIYGGLSGLLYEWNDLEAALHHALVAIERGKHGGDLDMLRNGYVTLAGIQWARGDVDGAQRSIQQLAAMQRQFTQAEAHARLAATNASLCVFQGKLAAAERWAKQRERRNHDARSDLRAFELLTLARLRLAQDQPQAVLAAASTLHELADVMGWTGYRIGALAFQALALHAIGDPSAALNTLGCALMLGESEGYVRTFVDAGPTLVPLLTQFRSAQQRRLGTTYAVSLAYTRTVLCTLLPQTTCGMLAPTEQAAPVLLEPLSARECEVLQLIVLGRTSHEIARELVIAASTVQSHIKIFTLSLTCITAYRRSCGRVNYT